MKIVVCVKEVPDTAATVVVEDGQVTWGEAPIVMNPWDEYAVEAALQQAEKHGGDVIAISFGGSSSNDALKHALAMGCSEAILISDEALAGADSLVTSHVLAAAIRKIADVDAAFFGKQAIDGDVGVTAAQTARVLGWPALTLVSEISDLDPGSGNVKVTRSMEEGKQVVESKLPATLNLVKDFGEPRYPSFMGIRKAAKAEIPMWSLSDLDGELPASSVEWPEIMNPPTREVVCEFIEGDTPEAVVEQLVDKLLAEKVL